MKGIHYEYWPALYFVDAQGHIRHHQFGEGDYERSEMVIQLIRQPKPIFDRQFQIEFLDSGVEVFAFTFG